MLREEVNPTLEQRPVLSARTVSLLTEELCSWLNEQGQAKVALPVLTDLISKNDKPRTSVLDAAQHSRLLRQFAFAEILSGASANRVETVLKAADDQTDHPQNRHGVINAKTILLLRERRYGEAYSLVNRQLDDLRLRSLNDFEHPERLGVSCSTLLGSMTHLIVTQLHDGRHGVKKHADVVQLLRKVENKIGHHAVMIWPPDCYNAALEAGGNIRFLRRHTMPWIPDYAAKEVKRALMLMNVL
jgi:hypothetical protein